ncbi:MAG: type II toxin-antitoxin system VapB family antitoxin [Verrucomicrobiota bacterium]
MKTTIDIDESKLRSLMELRGFKTRKEAIDHALTEAERQAKLDWVFSADEDEDLEEPVIDPNYDLKKMREMDKPNYPPGKNSWD